VLLKRLVTLVYFSPQMHRRSKIWCFGDTK